MKVKVESEKVGLKLNIQKTKIMAFGPTTSWEIDGKTVETVSDFILGGSKITADVDCSHEIKRKEEKFWPGEFHRQRSLVGYPWDRKELDMTERLHFTSLLGWSELFYQGASIS